ncbi:major facilitator superfamily domain-containing protein 8 [Neoarius graeffei]|uniref:major facilitator superfamily domain-containing protein 8 n=1 Tax=Neoarius graeffei TaxID=443677 RepID=UPI00298CC206|nr:major facilitator superfamily domain-containing protein 8 [Neoarius graeffei]XP_060796466.1 major facilitator superfamily domain-containing protein 8 [Neoarius graeffei]XP_060796467.1 major facilitator superfamily domain-containing protein 8 [Neoarius graeffei]
MDYGRKRKLTFITIGLIFLLSGVEYAVILPTIWRFLQTLDAAPYFLGLSLSAFSFSGLLSGPLFGFWSDRTHGTKKIIMFANCFEIIGNFMYFIGFSKWLLLSSRFVAGIGTGAGSCIFGFLTRITAPEDRATVFAAVMACRQAGLLIGPAFNIFLRLCDFQLGPFVVNKYTAPGIFMCLLWLLLQLVVLLMYWDLRGRNEGSEEDKQEEEERLLVQPTESYGTLHDSLVTDQTTANGSLTPPSPPLEQIHSNPFKHFSAAREFLREEVVVLLTAQFITLFNQTALETMVTPLTQQYFNFGELENSVMYCVCGVEVIAGFVFVRWISRKVEERVVLSIGLFLANISCVWCIIFLANPQGGFSWQLMEFIVGVFLQVLGLPFIAVAQVSLFSKVTAEKTQGFSQGIRRSVGGLATILGPLWAGSLTFNLYVMLGVMMGLLALLTIMMAFSYKRLVERTTVEHTEE